jgi:hypothetical protein
MSPARARAGACSSVASCWAARARAHTVTCTLDTVGRASFRTRETVATEDGVGVEAATTLEVPGCALSAAEREEPAR